MATHSSILAWKIPWTEEPGGLQSKGWQRVWHDWAIKHVRTLTLWRAISFTWSLPTYMLISSKNALRERFVIIFDQISLHCAQPSWHKLTHILCVTIGTWYLLSEWQNEWMNEWMNLRRVRVFPGSHSWWKRRPRSSELSVGSCSFHPTTGRLGMLTRDSLVWFPGLLVRAYKTFSFHIPQRSSLLSGVITKWLFWWKFSLPVCPEGLPRWH